MRIENSQEPAGTGMKDGFVDVSAPVSMEVEVDEVQPPEQPTEKQEQRDSPKSNLQNNEDRASVQLARVAAIEKKVEPLERKLERVPNWIAQHSAVLAAWTWRLKGLNSRPLSADQVEVARLAAGQGQRRDYTTGCQGEALLRLLFELDAVSTLGLAEVRTARKALVKRIEALMEKSDELRKVIRRMDAALAEPLEALLPKKNVQSMEEDCDALPEQRQMWDEDQEEEEDEDEEESNHDDGNDDNDDDDDDKSQFVPIRMIRRRPWTFDQVSRRFPRLERDMVVTERPTREGGVLLQAGLPGFEGKHVSVTKDSTQRTVKVEAFRLNPDGSPDCWTSETFRVPLGLSLEGTDVSLSSRRGTLNIVFPRRVAPRKRQSYRSPFDPLFHQPRGRGWGVSPPQHHLFW